ncbi:MAG TPA: amidohydrolase family protein [Thermoanaerobaculia bacterium]|jgi:imidazolonepropionase-like amidohydrolase
MKRLLFVLLLAPRLLAAADSTTVIRAAAMLDVRSGVLRAHPTIVIRGDRITAIRFDGKAPRNAKVIDLGDAVVLPGLIDTHVHLAWKPSPTDELALPGISKQAADDAKATLLAGFTTVRDLGSTGKADLLLRDAIARGALVGPRMLAAGPGIGAPGGACDRVFGGEAVAADAAQATQRVGEVIAAGADVVKICTGGGVIATNPNPKADMTADEVRAIVAAAKKSHRSVAAHAQGPQAIEAAVAGGVASIEHGGYLDLRLAQMMAKRGTYLVPTLYRVTFSIDNAPQNEALKKARELLEASFRNAVAARTPIAFGTDATVIPHGMNAREFAVLVRLGMTPAEAIRAATINAAALLGRSDLGELARGKRADIIAVSGSPLADVTTLERVAFVMHDGRVAKMP